MLFANLAGYAVKTMEDVASIRAIIENLLKPLGKKVVAIGNYDEFFIEPDLIDAYSEMQKYLTENYFTRVSRYTTSAFLRINWEMPWRNGAYRPISMKVQKKPTHSWHPGSSRSIKLWLESFK